jgi:hypothetical protein
MSMVAIFAPLINIYHRYLKKNRLLKFCYMPAASAASSNGIFAAATNSINQTSKAGSTHAIKESIA